MAYRQPRVPEYREQDGVGKTLKQLILFLKDFTMAAWTADNQRAEEAKAMEARLTRLEEELSALRAAMAAQSESETGEE